MVSLFLLLGCNLSYIVVLFAAWHELASASAHITKARIISARALKTLLSHLKNLSASSSLKVGVDFLNSIFGFETSVA